jgi:hypothetical protein
MDTDGYAVGVGAAVTGGNSATIYGRMTQNRALSVSLTEGEGGQDLTRNGSRFTLGVVGAITGIAPIQTLGLQVAAFGFTNLSTTMTMFIDTIGVSLESGTAGTTGNAVYASHYRLPTAAGMHAGMGVVNMNGGTNVSTTVAVQASQTITQPAASIWFPIAWDSQVGSDIGALSLVNDHVRGRICIQPLRSLGICTVGGAGTTPLFAPVLSWTEECCVCG